MFLPCSIASSRSVGVVNAVEVEVAIPLALVVAGIAVVGALDVALVDRGGTHAVGVDRRVTSAFN